MGWLRTLSVQQQTALLFVLVFGLLLLVSIGSLLWSLRELSSRQQMRLQRFGRELRAVWVGMGVFWLAWVSGPVGATLLFGVLSFLALREFITWMHTRRSDHRSLIAAFFVVLPLQYLLVGGRHFDLFSVFVPVYTFLALPVLAARAGDPERFLERTAKIQWGIMVCVFGLSHAPALLLLEFPRAPGRGPFLVFFLVWVMGVAQGLQAAVRQRVPMAPVAPAISRFSDVSWLLATLGGGLAGAALYWITPFKPWQAFAMAALAAAAGLLGGFVLQALQRDAGVRPWGQRAALTGAVGLLERVAPLAFAAPVFFHSVRWYFQLTP